MRYRDFLKELYGLPSPSTSSSPPLDPGEGGRAEGAGDWRNLPAQQALGKEALLRSQKGREEEGGEGEEEKVKRFAMWKFYQQNPLGEEGLDDEVKLEGAVQGWV